MDKSIKCEHLNLSAEVDVNRLPDIEGGPINRYCADVRIKCAECGLPFRFIGLPCGLDLNGAAVSVDATEAHLAIAPKGEVVSVMEGGVSGFSVRNRSRKTPQEIAREKVAEFVDRIGDADLSHADRLALIRKATNSSGIPHNAICFFQDGDRTCAVFGDFVDLQESPAGFGSNFEEAMSDLQKENRRVRSVESRTDKAVS